MLLEDELKAKALIDPDFAKAVGGVLMKTKPAPENLYIVKGIDRHMSFIELVKILQDHDSGVGPWHVKPLYHHRNNANGKDQTDIVVVALQPPKQEFAKLGSTWLRVGKYEPAYVDRPNQWSRLNWHKAREEDWTDPGASSLWSDEPMGGESE